MGYAGFQYEELVHGIQRSDALAGLMGSKQVKSSTGGDTNILIMGLDSRLDGYGNLLPRAIYSALHTTQQSASVLAGTLDVVIGMDFTMPAALGLGDRALRQPSPAPAPARAVAATGGGRSGPAPTQLSALSGGSTPCLKQELLGRKRLVRSYGRFEG